MLGITPPNKITLSNRICLLHLKTVEFTLTHLITTQKNETN